MRVRLTVPKEHVDEDTLNPALEASCAVAQKQIEAGLIPPLADAIAEKSVVWAPEPAGQGFEGFDLPTQVLDRGWGDCDDLAPWWAAELRFSGVDPDAKPIVYQSGPKRWHAIVQRGDGSTDDPSRWAGMGKPGSPLPKTRPLSANGAHAVAFKDTLAGTRVRLDVPLIGYGPHVGLALERMGDGPFDALGRAAGGALGLLGFWGSPDVTFQIMHAITHILSGRSEEEFYALHGCTYGDCGPFVSGLADRIGDMHANFSPNMSQAADIATTILDPLGIHKMIAPLAQDFVSNYAQGLAHRGESSDAPPKKAKKVKDDDTTSGDADACQSGWHWETRGGISVCVPNNPSVGARPAKRGGAARGGSRGGGARGGSRRSSSRDQGGDDGSVDPSTGLPIYYNQMAQEGGADPFASQYNEYGPPANYGMPPGFAPQQFSYPSFPQQPWYAGAPNPYGATLPGTDIAPDAWGGYATPTAFSQYIDQYEKGIRHSAFDDAPLLGDDRVWVTLKATGDKIQVPKDQVSKLRDADLINGLARQVRP